MEKLEDDEETLIRFCCNPFSTTSLKRSYQIESAAGLLTSSNAQRATSKSLIAAFKPKVTTLKDIFSS
jgi:hypothetical protein